MFYTIQNNGVLIANNKENLTKYYKNVFTLPEDYTPDKYTVIDNKLIPNPNFEKEKVQREKEAQNAELQRQIDALELKRTRALAEPAIKDETTGQTWLEFRTEQIRELREQMNKL